METKIALRYEGPAVDTGQMDVYEAAANMVAFSEFVVSAAKSTFGDSVDARASVAGFGRGSFVTDLVFNLAGVSATVFTVATPDHLWDIVKGALAIWKHLKGAPPAKVEYSGQQVSVTNNNGQIIQVQADSLSLVFSEKASEAAGQFVRKALERPGMDAVELTSERGAVGRITQAEGAFFTVVKPAEKITDATIRLALVIEAPVFKDGNKWRLHDGQQSFYAEMEDPLFLARVNEGERFGKGDVLIADVRISQEQSGMKITAERSVVCVHEHKVAATQLSFPSGSHS